jgi:hypothetical protein
MRGASPTSVLELMSSLESLNRHQARRLRERHADVPLTSVEKALLLAGFGLRRAKGRYRTAYALDELRIVHGARRLLLSRGQLRVANMLLVTKPTTSFKKLRLSLGQNPPERHPCPLCARVHHAKRVRSKAVRSPSDGASLA